MAANTSWARVAASLIVSAVVLAAPDAAHAAPDATQASTAPAASAPPPLSSKLKSLDEQLEDLADQIRKSQARITRLGEALFSSGGASARTTVKLENQLSRAFVVTRVLVLLDGAVLVNKFDHGGDLADQVEIPIYDGLVQPGDHTVQILVDMQGNGARGFPYFRAFKYQVRSTHSFTVVDDKTMKLDVVVYDKGNTTTPFEERPAVRYGEAVVSGISPKGNGK
jgi:hypothetical protein